MTKHDDQLREAAACLQLGEAELASLVSEVKTAVAAFLRFEPDYEKLSKMLPEVSSKKKAKIAEIAEMEERILLIFYGSEILYGEHFLRGHPEPNEIDALPLRGDRREIDEIANALCDAFTRATSFLEADLETYKSRRGNASKVTRDLLWNRLLEIWVSFGGGETGNDAARFLKAACARPEGGDVTAMPSTGTIVELLRKRRINKTKST